MRGVASGLREDETMPIINPDSMLTREHLRPRRWCTAHAACAASRPSLVARVVGAWRAVAR